MKVALKYLIHGTVQGVFYRQFLVEQAQKHNIKGYVRNLPESVVEIIAEGEDKDMQQFEEQIKVGPPRSQIRHIEKETRKWGGDFKEFKVIHF